MEVQVQTKGGLRTVNLNRRKAIRHACLNCSGWSRKEVTGCRMADCPLYPFRSGRGQQEAKARSKAIRSYCRWCQNDQLMEVASCQIRTCALFPFRKVRINRTVDTAFL